MEINVDKLVMCFNGVPERVESDTKELYNFQTLNFNDGFKYLGYKLKPNSYGN